ncbi:hypothetical protein CIHG_07560 [Coccidioides immitis H538.4]|uniref:Uncharacterized protein n=2 Tax=Coccidioides immitis TaxID=5501 RepID=A0A0J8RYL8_COCIT|nr:hypothetical protein CIRG_07852 [Coccidioides immitis RMSCC 2394]KMU89877.1 hypothetical protein CIHG_07560 [Coccidioides immitis H538.4]
MGCPWWLSELDYCASTGFEPARAPGGRIMCSRHNDALEKKQIRAAGAEFEMRQRSKTGRRQGAVYSGQSSLAAGADQAVVGIARQSVVVSYSATGGEMMLSGDRLWNAEINPCSGATEAEAIRRAAVR